MIENEENIQEETASAEEATEEVSVPSEKDEVSPEGVEAVHSAQGTVNSEQEDEAILNVLSEAAAFTEKVPGFDLGEELKNPRFAKLIYAGVPVEDAFVVSNLPQILGIVAENAARDSEKKIAASIASGMERPAEIAESQSAPRTQVPDVTSKEYREKVRELMFKANAEGKRLYPDLSIH